MLWKLVAAHLKQQGEASASIPKAAPSKAALKRNNTVKDDCLAKKATNPFTGADKDAQQPKSTPLHHGVGKGLLTT